MIGQFVGVFEDLTSPRPPTKEGGGGETPPTEEKEREPPERRGGGDRERPRQPARGEEREGEVCFFVFFIFND